MKTLPFIAAAVIVGLSSITYASDVRLYAEDGTYLGKVNNNRHDPESIANPDGKYGSKYSPTSINNETGTYGSKFSLLSANNPTTAHAPDMYGTGSGNGPTYLGKKSANQYDSRSSSNPYGQYGSRYSPTSTNNPYSVWGRAVAVNN
ncbi:hypothetical protein R80B4_02460 [Fibrobacteres bacterium R8-0-B4]